MSAKFTPGPWVMNTAGSAKQGKPFTIDEVYVYAPETQDDVAICAEVIDPLTQKPSEANARLIAAAPELLDVLKRAVRRLEIAHKNGDTIMSQWIFDARDAIAKATGEQQ